MSSRAGPSNKSQVDSDDYSTARPNRAHVDPNSSATSLEIPIVQLKELIDAEIGSSIWHEAVKNAAASVRSACHDTGFFYVSGHGIADTLVESILGANRAFHNRPESEKLTLRLNAWHRGYQPLRSTQMHSSARFDPAPAPNELESFIVRESISPDHPHFKHRPFMGPNQWPNDPEFQNTVERYYAAARQLARKLLPVFSVAVGQKAGFFEQFCDPPGTALRLIHYPPAPKKHSNDFIGIYPHTDYGFFTILAQDDVGGLEIQRVDGSWIEAWSVPGTFVVNIGDTLARWTNDTFTSSPHRVINRSTGRSRYSVAMFFDPNYDAQIQCIENFVPNGDAAKYPPIKYIDYYQERMDSNHPGRRSAD